MDDNYIERMGMKECNLMALKFENKRAENRKKELCRKIKKITHHFVPNYRLILILFQAC